MSQKALTDVIFEAGIIGCGGAGFPTHVKYSGQGIEDIIINGAECEPILKTDRYLMRHKADAIIEAADALMQHTGAKTCTIGLKENYKQEIENLSAAIAKRNSKVSLKPMRNFYPLGDEQILVYEITGKIVPPAGIPLDVGCAVSNIATVNCIYNAMQGVPFTQKFLTVTGEVENPVILEVPVGTPVAHCLKLAGGSKFEDYIVINGGPMMGKIMTKEEAENAFVTKTMSALIVLPADSFLARHNKISLQHMANRARSSCIQCSYCTQMCPRYLIGHPLQPHKIMRKLAINTDFTAMLNDPDIQAAALCSQCGVCEMYACPMGLQPRRINMLVKDTLAQAGLRYAKGTGEYTASPDRDGRKANGFRVAARVGVDKYYRYKIDTLLDAHPDRITVSLKQGAGAPSEPVVQVGAVVNMGDLIAKCPDGKLGSNIHAGICGKVIAIDGSIVIERQEVGK